MKARTLYTCEICHTDYADKEKAKAGVPIKIRVRFGDRWIEYKR